MTLLGIAHLQYHPDFTDRCRSSFINQSVNIMDDTMQPIGTPEEKQLAKALLSDDPVMINTFIRTLSATPGWADMADIGDAVMDPSLISDEEIRSSVLTQWPRVAWLFYGDPSMPMPPPGEVPPPGTEVPPVETTVTAVSPISGGVGITVTVTGTGLTDTTLINISKDLTGLTVVDDSTVTGVVPSFTPPQKGTFPVLVTVGGNVFTGPNFTVT